MTGATHVVLALGTLGIQRHFTGSDLSAAGTLMILLGSLAPDIDGGGLIARPGRLFRPWIGRRGASIVSAPTLLLSGAVRGALGHRGFLHTPFFAGCMALVGFAFGIEWLVFFTWGYVTHIVGDLCTMAGIPLVGPFSWKRYRVMSVRNGTLGEVVVAGFLVMLCVLWSGSYWFVRSL